MKKILALLLVLAMALSLVACGGKEEVKDETQTETQTEEKTEEKVMTEEEELEAMKDEPAYAEGFTYFESGGCTSAPFMADHLGYFEKYGIKAEAYRGGDSWKEAIGTNAAQCAVNHIATCLVPAANDVNYAIVNGAMIGCQSLWVLGDSEYNSLEDLKGKTVSIGAPGSGVYFNAVDVLAAAGMTEEDIVPQYQSFADSADALKDGKIDAFFCTAGAPTVAITDLSTTTGIVLVEIDADHLAKLQSEYGFYAAYTVPAGTYTIAQMDASELETTAIVVSLVLSIS